MKQLERLTKLETQFQDCIPQLKRDVKLIKYIIIAYIASQGVISAPEIAKAFISLIN